MFVEAKSIDMVVMVGLDDQPEPGVRRDASNSKVALLAPRLQSSCGSWRSALWQFMVLPWQYGRVAPQPVHEKLQMVWWCNHRFAWKFYSFSREKKCVMRQKKHEFEYTITGWWAMVYGYGPLHPVWPSLYLGFFSTRAKHRIGPLYLNKLNITKIYLCSYITTYIFQ